MTMCWTWGALKKPALPPPLRSSLSGQIMIELCMFGIRLVGQRHRVGGAGGPVALVAGVLDPEVERGIGEGDVDATVEEALQEVGEAAVGEHVGVAGLGEDQVVVGAGERSVRRRVDDELADRLDRRRQQAALVVVVRVVGALPVLIVEAVGLGVDRHPIGTGGLRRVRQAS